MYHLYVDETGNTSAGASNRHTQRYLNLTGVIIKDTAKPSLERHYDIVRSENFGHKPERPIVLHRVKLNSGKGIYERLRDRFAREAFETDYLYFLKQEDFTVITVTLDKVAFYYQHESWTGEPYEFCAMNMIERFCLFLHHRKARGTVTVETRNPKPDELFRSAYNEFCASGNRFITGKRARHMIGHTPLSIASKNDDVIGCQMADFLCQPLLEGGIKNFRGKGTASDWHKKLIREAWPKLYRDKYGRLTGCGLVWRPR